MHHRFFFVLGTSSRNFISNPLIDSKSELLKIKLHFLSNPIYSLYFIVNAKWHITF